MAVDEGFEPSRRLAAPYRFSKPASSTTWVTHQSCMTERIIKKRWKIANFTSKIWEESSIEWLTDCINYDNISMLFYKLHSLCQIVTMITATKMGKNQVEKVWTSVSLLWSGDSSVQQVALEQYKPSKKEGVLADDMIIIRKNPIDFIRWDFLIWTHIQGFKCSLIRIQSYCNLTSRSPTKRRGNSVGFRFLWSPR